MLCQCLVLWTSFVMFVCAHQQWNYVDLLNEPGRKIQELEDTSASHIALEEFQSALFDVLLTAKDDYVLWANRFQKILLSQNKKQSVSPECNKDLAHFMVALTEKETTWALPMLDAFGKPKPGIMTFALSWVGLYEECVAVRSPAVNASSANDVMFTGKYCTAALPFQEAASTPGIQMNAPGLYIGLCLPSSCNSTEMVYLLNSVIEDLNIPKFKFRFNNTYSKCQQEDLEYDDKAIAAIVVGSLFAVILFVGTAYDLMMIQLPKYMFSVSESEHSVNDNMESGEPTMNINKHLRSTDEQSPLLGETKASINFEAPEPSVCGKLLLSFSMYSNGVKLLSTKQPKGSLNCVHGIRFLSMTWVILGHTLVFGIAALDNFASFFPPLLKNFWFQAILNATVSVDSFFTLSGLLVGYLTLKELKKREGKLNWAMFYFHRYWRLTPPLAFLMLLYVPLFPYMSNGALWPQQGLEPNHCSGTWWTNLLYVNNLVKTHEMCMGWTWYLANDMQFYVLSPLLILPLYYSRRIGFVVCAVFLLATTITAGVISTTYSLGASLASVPQNNTGSGSLDYFFEYYIPPYCRMGPYIIGLVTGYYLYATDLKIRLNKVVVVVGWSVATASALAVLYGLYDPDNTNPLSVGVASFYNAVNRTVWGACLCWVIVACVGGYGGPVNVILSWKAFIPLSRLTYCAYLIHPIVMYVFYYSQQKLFYLTNSMYVFLFFAFLVASYMIAFIMSLMFESPMMGLENVIFKRQKR